MIFFTELKRILLKAPILIMVCVIIPILIISVAIVGINPPSPLLIELQTNDYTIALSNYNNPNASTVVSYTKDNLNAPLKDLAYIVFNDTTYAKNIRQAFQIFTDTWTPFFAYNYNPTTTDSLTEFQNLFLAVNNSYLNFNSTTVIGFSGFPKILIEPDNYKILNNSMKGFEKHFESDISINVQSMTAEDLFKKRKNLSEAWDNYAIKLPQVLQSITDLKFTSEQKTELQKLYLNQIEPFQDELDKKVFECNSIEELQFAISRYADYVDNSCEYLRLKIKLIQSNNVNNIASYYKFDNFNETSVRNSLAILSVLVSECAATFDYSVPFTFGEVINKTKGTTVYDFIFNNFEIISIPLIMLSVLIVCFCIFNDIKKNTVITTLVSPQSRKKLIIAKLFACAVSIAILMIVFLILFYITFVFILGAGISTPPVILTAFNGKALKISAFTTLMIYVLSLFFKTIFFATVTALFCINGKSIYIVILKSLFVIFITTMLNVLFTIIIPLAFYQYIPLIATDFAGCIGISFMLSHHIASINILLTLPLMVLIWFAVLHLTIDEFNKKDF